MILEQRQVWVEKASHAQNQERNISVEGKARTKPDMGMSLPC
jgi:hypothetical protein